jgi:hypothetical protein
VDATAGVLLGCVAVVAAISVATAFLRLPFVLATGAGGATGAVPDASHVCAACITTSLLSWGIELPLTETT